MKCSVLTRTGTASKAVICFVPSATTGSAGLVAPTKLLMSKTAELPALRELQVAKRLRPLARRALSTARPPRLLIRTKKPWVRARRVLDA